MIKLVLFGWGVEFGKYYCGGAPAKPARPDHHGGMYDAVPAVPCTWSWGLGVYWRTYHRKPWPDRSIDYRGIDATCCAGWWWHSRWFYSAYQYPANTEQRERFLDKMLGSWNQ
jgi:hypothetical protein